MKRLLLVFLILSSNLFAEQGETILNHPQDSDCGDDFAFFAQEDIEREIAEFEAKLAKELADQAAQEIMAEIKAEAAFEAKAKLPNTVCDGPDSLIRFCDDNPTDPYCEGGLFLY